MNGTLFRDQELTRSQDVATEARQRGAGLWNRENRFYVFKARVNRISSFDFHQRYNVALLTPRYLCYLV